MTLQNEADIKKKKEIVYGTNFKALVNKLGMASSYLAKPCMNHFMQKKGVISFS